MLRGRLHAIHSLAPFGDVEIDLERVRFRPDLAQRTSAIAISTPLRIEDRPGHRNRFLAVCIVIVEAPRRGPLAPASSMTSCSAPQSTPSFWQKRASSDVTTEASAAGATSPSLTGMRS